MAVRSCSREISEVTSHWDGCQVVVMEGAGESNQKITSIYGFTARSTSVNYVNLVYYKAPVVNDNVYTQTLCQIYNTDIEGIFKHTYFTLGVYL